MPLKVEPIRDRKLYRHVKAAPTIALRRRDRLYEQGTAADHVYLVRHGHVRLTLRRGGRKGERTAALVGPWEMFGDEGLAPGSLRHYSAVAGAPTQVAVLDPGHVRGALRTSQHTLLVYLEATDRALARARASSSGAGGPSAAQRIAAVVEELADRMGEPGERGLRIPHRLPHRVLADLAGVHRSTLTTALNEWIYQGILEETPEGLLVAQGGALARIAARGGAGEPG